MQNINNERWRSSQAVSPNNKINSKTSRSMPQWLQTRGSALPPPPPPPTQAELTNHVDPDYEVIEFSNNQAYINAPIMNHGKGKEGRRCDLCGSSAPSVKCDKCAQQNFCYSCDDMYHRHPKRQSHIRKPLEPSKANFRPPLPPKGENSSAPVPPPRRNKRMSRTSTPGPPEQGFKKDGSLMGSLRRMMGTRPLPPTPTLISRDPRQDKMMEFQDQPPSRDSGYLDWELDSRHRSGSLTALNAPNFAPLMHAQSMAQLNCPSCQHHGMVWDWNHQHNMAGGFNRPPAWNGLPTGTWHGSAMIPQFKQESSMDGFRRNSLRPRRSRRDLASDMSGEEDETMFRRRHTSPARSRRGMVSDFDDSDDDDMRSHKSGRRGSRRRVSPTRNVSPALSRKSSRKLSVEEMINQRLKKNDEDNFPPRGRNYDDQDTVSLRGGRRTDDEVSSNRGGRRYQDDEVTPRRRYDDETMSQRGNSRRNSNVLDDTHSNRGGRRNSEVRRRRDRSPVAKCHVPARSNKEPSSEDSGDELSDENKEPPKIISKEKNGDVVEKEVVKSIEETNGKESATETEEPLGPIPTQQWECDHCTFVNRAGTRVCTVCCKTTSKPKYVDDKKKKEAVTSKQPPLPKQQSVADVDLVKRMDDMSFSDNTLHKDAAPETEEEKRRKKKGPDHDIPDVREKVVASTGTSPPPQSISTQTYDILRPKLRRAASLADHDLWAAPQRSVSRQSLTSDSQSLPLTPSRSQSPGAESLPSWGDLHLKRDVAGARDQLWGDLQSENGNVRNNLQMTRRPSEPALNSRAVVRRAGSQPPEYFNTLVQKQMKQGLEMVKLLREAEDNQFNADELAIALNQCGEGNPVSWLVNNWRNMIDTVVTLATNYGHERKENTVGTISVSEAKEALILHQGNVWAAVTECIEQRQKKYADLMSRGNFTREDIVTVLTANHGNLESAFLELNKNQLKPFLMRIWGPPQGTDNDSGNIIGLQQTDGTEFVEKAKSIDTQESNTSDEVSDENNANEAPRYSQVKSWLETTLSDKDSDRVEKNVLEQQLRKVSMSEDEEYVGTMRLQSIPHKPTNQQLIELAKQQNKWKSESQLLHYYDNEEFISNRKRKKKLREEKAKTVYTDSLGDRNVIERLILDGNIQQVTRHLEDQYRLDEGDQIDYQDNIREQLFNTVLKNADHKRNNERSREVIDDTNLPFVNINEIASKLNLKHVASNDVKSKGKNLKNLLKSYSHDEQDRHSSIEELAIHPQNIRPTIFNAISNASNSPESFNRSEDGTVKSVENGLNLAQMNDIVEPEIVTSSKLIVALDKNMIDKIKSDQLSTKNNVMSENIQINNKQNPQKGNNPLKRSSSLDIKVSTLQIQINGNKNIGKVSSPESVHKSDILNHDTISEANFSNSKQDIDNTNSETVQVNRSEKVEIIPELGIISRDPTNEKYFEDIFVRTVNSSENDTKTTDNEDEDTEEFLDTLQSPIEDIQETANEIIEDNIEEPIVPVNQTSIFISQDLDKNETSDESILYSFPNNDATPISSPSTPISERLLESYSSNSSQKTSSSIAESRAEILDLLKASLSDDQVLDRIVFSLFSNVLGDRTTTSDDPKTKIDTNPNNYKDLSKSPLPAKRLSISSESEINAESEFFEAEEEVESVPLHEAPVTVVPSSNLHELKNQDLDSATANMKVADEQVEVRSAPIETIITPKARDVVLERLKDIVENTVVFKDTNPTITKNNGIERNSSSENIKQNIEDKEQAVKVEHNYKNQGTHEPATLAQQTALQENIIKNVATEDEIEEVETDGEEEIEEHEEEVEEEEEGEVEYEELIEVEENEEKEEEESLQKAEKSEIKENLVIEHEKLVISNREEETDINKEEENSVGEVAKHDDSAAPIDPIKDRERQARRYLAEGFVETYDQAELAVQLMELEFDRELSLSTAKECSSLPAALALLQQECQLCAEKYTMKQMISMLECEHFCCEGCATHYFTLQITERSINDCVCPFCKKPNLDSFDGDQALNYFSNLDIQLKGFLEPAVHELFQRKLRDRTLMQDPNFKWCAKCSSGFIANPRQRRLVCPDCRSITCASCRRPWEKQHEGVSCAEYAAWLEKNDPENQIDQHLAEHGVTCPKCMARYSLSRGGCMHLTCPHCKHEFCSGCANPFVMGAKCTVSEYCAKLGLHAHHPRNCLFYLRDKEPQLLQKLLDDNNVEYKKELPEKEGARCTMQLQRETPDGMIDVVCSQPVIFSALCRTHYIEYLVKQIGQQKLDPVAILDLNEAQQELRRRGKPLPDRPGHLTDHDYLKLCAKIVKEEIPLE